MTSDPTREPARWDRLFSLLRQMDEDIEHLYVRRSIEGVRARFVRPILRLHHEGPMTISALGRSLGTQHSATSQTVAAMRRAGFVTTEPGADGRTREVTLTGTATALVPLFEAEWRATDRVVAGLDDELDGAVTHLSTRLAQALETRPMSERLDDELDRGRGPAS